MSVSREQHEAARVAGKLTDPCGPDCPTSDVVPQRAPCIDGGQTHAWHADGLDTRQDKLVNVRTCVWCGKEQTKPYGARKGAWR